MAVYTNFTDDQLKKFLAEYDVGEVLSCKGIAEGVENSNFFLHTEKANYILTIYEKRVAKEDLPFFVGLMEHLAKNGFPCPLPVRMKGGEAIGELANKPATIVSYLEGIAVDQPSEEQFGEAGKTIAQLHKITEGFEMKRKNALNMDGWKKLVADIDGRADEVEDGLQKMIQDEMKYLERQWVVNLPTGVIHADFFKDNVFFIDGNLSGVIDFYFACDDLLAYDIAIAICAWCFDDDLNFLDKKCRAMVDGYESIRKLEQDEKNGLGVLTRGAAFRFLLTRTFDWLNVPKDALVVPHNPIPFAKRLAFFQNYDVAKEIIK